MEKSYFLPRIKVSNSIQDNEQSSFSAFLSDCENNLFLHDDKSFFNLNYNHPLLFRLDKNTRNFFLKCNNLKSSQNKDNSRSRIFSDHSAVSHSRARKDRSGVMLAEFNQQNIVIQPEWMTNVGELANRVIFLVISIQFTF